MFLTLGYKNGWIHFKWSQGIEEITYQTFDYVIHKAKSIHQAKIGITRYQV